MTPTSTAETATVSTAIDVRGSVEHTFRVFTDRIGTWWTPTTTSWRRSWPR